MKRYNGNIGEIDWTYGTTTSNRYDYTYDNLNRLKKADFKSVSTTTTNSKFYNEELEYDKNGNITNLKRYGKTSASTTTGTLVDNLDYTYNGNMVTAIADATGNNSGYKGIGLPITYDENGNMLTFPDKGITQNIVYNFLNLPQQILQNSNSTTYTYRADGVKVKKHSIINSENLFTEYLDGFVYTSPYTLGTKAALEQDDEETRETVTGRQEEAIEVEEMAAGPGNPPTQYIVNLSFFPTAEGFYDYENFKYIYQYKDHLGNVRLSYSKNSAGVLQKLDTNDYYPFGLNFITTGSLTPSFFSPVTTFRNWKYNGKELQETGMYDYGARFYMPDIGRWGVVDPLAETSRRWSTFTYAYNNPIRFIDPDGRMAISSMGDNDGDFFDRQGNYLGNDGKDDGKVYLLNEDKRAKTENTSVNWGGTLSKKHATELKNASTEVGGLIIQDRVEEGSDYTISEIRTVGGEKNVTGYMLEPAGPSTATPNQDKRIPEGVYDLENYSSKKYPDNFLLSNKDVSKSRLILYHAGNNGGNTEGCNMPGTTKGNGVVGGSKAKMQELRTFIHSKGANNVKTIINNKIP